MNIAAGSVKQLTNRLGNLNAPEISPDGTTIVFKRAKPNSDQNQIYLMGRNGTDPNNIPKILGWDPTWSPDGKYILFASDINGTIQLYTVRTNGRELHQISNLPSIRGRSDWSPDGKYIVTYSGDAWNRDVYIMNADGSNARVLSPKGGDSQGPSFSPDSQWVTFTAYFDHPKDDNGCEIYIVRVDGSDLRRLTNNDYCDYQPRWGP
jgi:TolB protein